MGAGHSGEAFAGYGRLQVVVVLGDQRIQRVRDLVPLVQLSRVHAVQRRGEQNRAGELVGVFGAVLEHQFGAERPANQPRIRQGALAYELQDCVEVLLLSEAAVKDALAGAANRGGAARIEAQHRDICQRGQAEGRLLVHVRVHVAAVGGQRVEGHQGCLNLALGQGQLTDQALAVGGSHNEILAACRQDGASLNGGGFYGGVEDVAGGVEFLLAGNLCGAHGGFLHS